MTAEQIAAIGGFIVQAEQLGMEIIGGVGAVVSLVKGGMSEDERQAAIAAVEADAKARRDARDLSGGDPGDETK